MVILAPHTLNGVSQDLQDLDLGSDSFAYRVQVKINQIQSQHRILVNSRGIRLGETHRPHDGALKFS